MMQKRKNERGFGAVIAVLAVVGLVAVGAATWYLWQSQHGAPSVSSDRTAQPQMGLPTASSQHVFSVPELGVTFEIKGDITPLYAIASDKTANGVSFKRLSFSTQQVVDKGASQSSGGNNLCQFVATARSSTSHVVFALAVYESQADAVKALANNRSFSAADIKPTNGYVTAGNRIFYVPQKVEEGDGDCMDDAFENQQRVLLRESLMTIRAQ
jgi:hypothetical protein